MARSSAAVIKFRPVPRRHGFSEGLPPDGASAEQPFISNGRLAVLALIATESMLFSGLIGSFLVFKLSAPFWPPPAMPRLPIAITLLNTAVLLASGATMAMAVHTLRRDRRPRHRQWLGLTLALGASFLLIQGTEWVRLIGHGLKLSSGTYGATFYTLIGCHGAHVAAGTIWLGCVLIAALRGRYSARRSAGVEVCALYWYFVCAIWPLLFVLVYL
jgi:heme/copper-type cytochrome/quinol oxidase subunit 3